MNYKAWADEKWEKAVVKLRAEAERHTNEIPYIPGEDGMYTDMVASGRASWWTNGFWGGMMWLMYQGTKEEIFAQTARNSEKLLDQVLAKHSCLDHDVGFLWHITAGANYRLNGDEEGKNRALLAASMLASRFNDAGRFIRAWNGPWNGEDTHGWAIIDCMMNIPLLYWASRELDDDRFKYIAMAHADTTMENHVRPDGSVNHIMVYDHKNGGVLGVKGGQGYDENSAWSRGQAWAIYGFVLSYIHTGKKEYLDTAKKVANFFIASVCDDWLPKSDLIAPEEPVIYDTSAGTCAACGMLEIAKCVPENEGRKYVRAAMNILMAIEERFCDWNPSKDSIVQMGSELYHVNGNPHRALIYADYFFVEALYKIKELGPLFW